MLADLLLLVTPNVPNKNVYLSEGDANPNNVRLTKSRSEGQSGLQTKSSSDAATGFDGGEQLVVVGSTAEAGVGSETVVLTTTATGAETGQGAASSANVVVVLAGADGGVCVEAQSVSMPSGTAKFDGDTGSGLDASVLVVVNVSASDSGSGADAAVLLAQPLDSESATGTATTSFPVVATGDADTGQGRASAYVEINGVRYLQDDDAGAGREVSAFFMVDVFQTLSAFTVLMNVRQEMVV